jgi:hypothetical protein
LDDAVTGRMTALIGQAADISAADFEGPVQLLPGLS